MKAKSLAMLGLLSAILSEPSMNRRGNRDWSPKPSPEPPIPNGCKKYTIDGITVVAISEKSARKKVARRLGK